jgi:phospholipase C
MGLKLTRRSLLKTIAGVSGATLLGPSRFPVFARSTATGQKGRGLPKPDNSGIEQVVVVMMENRSFDHLFGWHPNADGIQAGLTYFDRAGVPHDTHALAPDYLGCGHPDPDHSYEGGRVQFHDGAMDGFLVSGDNDEYAIGYYVESDRPFYSALARNYTTLDRYFCSILGPTYPNRFFMHAAQTDRLSNTLDLATMPAIWDSLAAVGVSAGYYYSNLPFVILWGTRYQDITRTYEQFKSDAEAGQLPAVSFLDPTFTVADDGTGNDDHPHADIRRGDAFLAEAFHAVATGPQWASTVFIVNYDEWGGFYDHVPAPRAAAPNLVDPDLVDGRARLGFRVPTVVASPFTAGDPTNPSVSSTVFDHTSILKLIEWRFGLDALTARDASDDIGNLVCILDFENPHVEVPDLPLPDAPPPQACGTLQASAQGYQTGRAAPVTANHWARLARSSLLDGWPAFGR